jgi:hypothetical protein
MAEMADRRDTAGRVLHKTTLCQFFLAGTTCKYGDKCHFIHDVSEARRRPDKLGRKQGPCCVADLPIAWLPATSVESSQRPWQAG